MNAKPTLRGMWSRVNRGPGLKILTVLVLVGALVQACSDNKGPDGPTFPSGVTGTAPNGAENVFVGINPNSLGLQQRAGITVVVRNANGVQLAGRHVQLSTTAGKLDVVDGFTDKDGKFVSFILCDGTFTSATITAFVDASLGSGSVTCAAASSSSSSSSSSSAFNVALSIAGTGTGRVFSTPTGIDCTSPGCTSQSASFSGQVTLVAVANTGSAFQSWTGGVCNGSVNTQCIVSTATALVATFNLSP